MGNSNNELLENIQGDVWPGLPKYFEKFVFFKIKENEEGKFKEHLRTILEKGLITTAKDALEQEKKIAEFKKQHAKEECGKNGVGDPPRLQLSGFNVSFSRSGLTKLGKAELDQVSGPFTSGMKDDLKDGDHPEAPKESIDGILIITGDQENTTQDKLDELSKEFKSIEIILSEDGNVRPCQDRGKEHFGFEDGISQPEIQEMFQIKELGLGHEDGSPAFVQAKDIFVKDVNQASWATDGAFMAFRKLKQLVPEFNKFLHDNKPGHEEELGAQLVGRWKNGEPIVKQSTKPQTTVKPPTGNKGLNVFNYEEDSEGVKCPLAAHIRKTRPREREQNIDFVNAAPILRRGIPYGPEVDKTTETEQTIQNRGLLFVSYDRNLQNGFSFIQNAWVNNSKFIRPLFRHGTPDTGLDPIIGKNGTTFHTTKGKPIDTIIPWVKPMWGEYFFSPSKKGLEELSK